MFYPQFTVNTYYQIERFLWLYIVFFRYFNFQATYECKILQFRNAHNQCNIEHYQCTATDNILYQFTIQLKLITKYSFC